MLNHLLSDHAKSISLGKNRNVAVHITIYFNASGHIQPVGFQSTIKVVQAYSAYPSCGPVEQFCGNSFAKEGIEAFLLPSADHIIPFLDNHPTHLGNLLGTILEIGIHGDYHISHGLIKTGVEGSRFSVIPAKLNAPDLIILLL